MSTFYGILSLIVIVIMQCFFNILSFNREWKYFRKASVIINEELNLMNTVLNVSSDDICIIIVRRNVVVCTYIQALVDNVESRDS